MAASTPPPATDPFEAAAAAPDTPPAPPRRRSRLLRWLVWGTVDLLALLLVLAGALWWWAGSSSSLAVVLEQAQRFLPAGQTLQASEVRGSLRAGGQIGSLRWQSPDMVVEVQQLDIGWRLRPLLQRELRLGQLHAQSITIERIGEPDPSPTEPLQELTLQLQLDVPFRVDTLRWAGPPPLQIAALAGHYRYDGQHHQLTVDGVDVADGHYSAQLQLQGAAPMALDATLQGRITTPVPGSPQPPLALAAQAQVHGTLAGTQARLQAQAQVQPDASTPSTPSTSSPAMQAKVQADIAPWAPQPLLQAQADFQALDLARLWPDAPATLLGGTVSAGPAQPSSNATATPTGGTGTDWNLQADIRNSLPGPWDQRRLPASQVSARAQFDGSTWVVPAATVQVGRGEVRLQGQWSPAPAPWQLQATVQQLSPAALHTQLAPDLLSGQATAQHNGQALQFDVALKTPATKAGNDGNAPASARTLRLDSLVAKGQWQQQGPQHVVELRELQLRANQAELQGQLQLQTQDMATSGQIRLTVPGAQAQVKGRIAPQDGAGSFDVQLQDAARTQRWLRTLPAVADALGASLQGSAHLQGSWTGGWASTQALLATGKPAPASQPALRLQATLDMPRLDISAAAATPPSAAGAKAGKPTQATTPQPQAQAAASPPGALQLRGVRAEFNGQVSQASLSLHGSATAGEQKLTLQTRAEGGMQAPGQWRGSITELKLQADHQQWQGPWRVLLDKPVDISARSTAPRPDQPLLAVQASAASASLQGPHPGTARLVWDPVQYTRSGPPDKPQHQLKTRGQLQNLPMAWAELVASNASESFRKIGLLGDMVFAGSWDIEMGDTLRASVKLARTAGDIQVQTGELPNPTVVTSTGPTIRPAPPVRRPTIGVPASETIGAGVRQAQLSLDVLGEAVSAQVLWDSEHAGQLQAKAQTRLTRSAGAWDWPADAPLAGTLKAHLPSVGVWSMMAPPGWRVQGTVEADASLSGTRSAPRWNGNLAADGMSLRSVVDGMDLRDGRLRAVLRGERLDITELRLRGGTGAVTRIGGFSGNRSTATSTTDGGILSGTGFVTWADAGGAGSGSGIRMRFDAEARALRVLVRADRQVNLSGTVQARLDDGQFTLRANLRADRAAIIMADESAPQLDKDVVVRSAAHPNPVAAAQQESSGPQARPQTPKPPDVLVVFNLGDDFAVQGHGLTTRLTGELEIRSNGGLGSPPRVTGEIRTDRGKFRAYGQQLDVETGVVRFNGAMDNPALDILALRPNISVRAGVQITGTTQSPRVRLYSDPVLPDAEKLSWVVLGHGTANGGAEAALLQQAALALLGRRGVGQGDVASRLRLDEVGFRAPADGETASGAVLTVGKRLSQNLYVTYESSLSGALGTLFIFYDLTRNLTLRGQTGSRSAVDLIYTVSFD